MPQAIRDDVYLISCPLCRGQAIATEMRLENEARIHQAKVSCHKCGCRITGDSCDELSLTWNCRTFGQLEGDSMMVSAIKDIWLLLRICSDAECGVDAVDNDGPASCRRTIEKRWLDAEAGKVHK